MTPAQRARLDIAGAGLEMMKITAWVCDNYETIDVKAANWIGTVMILAMQYANTTVGILNQPNVNATPAGKRCIFY